MIYTVKGLKIQSKNAARDPSHTNAYILEILSSLNRGSSLLDYGCGKLRYSFPMARRFRKVVGVDSVDQLESVFCFRGKKGTAQDHALRFPNLSIFNLSQLGWRRRKYDTVLCIHVLSAIPSLSQRAHIVQTLASVVKRKGELIIINTLSDAYYKIQGEKSTSIKYLDGFISTASAKPTFFGFVDPDYLSQMCQRAGFSRISVVRNGSIYVLRASF